MADLKSFGVPALILAGGEPLLRPDIFEISRHAKEMGFFVALATNGTLIAEDLIDRIAAIGYDYISVSIDGMRKTHDHLRRTIGAFDTSMRAIHLCRERRMKVWLRFTLMQDNLRDLPDLLDLMNAEDIGTFHLAHLDHGGDGGGDFDVTRQTMNFLFERCLEDFLEGRGREFVTENNDADGAHFLSWVSRRCPDKSDHIRAKLSEWGGNAAGAGVANIDNIGNVHPDASWSHYSLGNVRARPFGDIWSDTSDPLMRGLRTRPRPVRGRCAECRHLAICNGNSRARADQTSGDAWTEDPACYLTDREIGVLGSKWIEMAPYRKRLRGAAS